MSYNVCCGPEPMWKGPAPVFFFFFFNIIYLLLLEYSCFTILCSFLPYSCTWFILSDRTRVSCLDIYADIANIFSLLEMGRLKYRYLGGRPESPGAA